MQRALMFAVSAAACLGILAPERIAAQSAATDPQSCKKLWEGVGLPVRKSGQGHLTIVCHLGYIAGHNDKSKTPEWVIEHLTPNLTAGNATREDQDFHFDPALPDAARAVPADYDGSGFDQGHNAPAADFAGDQKFLDDTFFLSNSVPQVGAGFNRSIWRSFETLVRKLVGGGRSELYVITGSVAQSSPAPRVLSKSDICKTALVMAIPDKKSICPANRDNDSAKCEAGVAVPAGMFKIVYDPNAGSAFAVLMENKVHTGLYPSGKTFEYIQAHKVGIATIEDLTGLAFFSALPDRKQRQLRASCTDVKFH